MTEEQKKEMLNGIINNGEKWECRKVVTTVAFGVDLHSDWLPYKLGDEIHSNWEYRKVEKWYVVKETNQTFTICSYEKAKQYNSIHFEGSKEECEKWVEEYKKTWLEETYGDEAWITDDIDGNEIRISAIEDFSKKLLEEVSKNFIEHILILLFHNNFLSY